MTIKFVCKLARSENIIICEFVNKIPQQHELLLVGFWIQVGISQKLNLEIFIVPSPSASIFSCVCLLSLSLCTIVKLQILGLSMFHLGMENTIQCISLTTMIVIF